MTELIINFRHYEHQGITLELNRDVGGVIILLIKCLDTQNVLLKAELPSTIHLFDRRN